jgi:adenylate cyclase class 2
MQCAEIELKFPVGDPDALQSRLPALGFQLDTPRTFEENTLYDTPARTLRGLRQILRLRQYGGLWTVTHKRQANSSGVVGTPRYKVRIETETRVDDGPALGAIFEQLGYAPVFRYEKFRTEWSQAIPGPGAPSLAHAAPSGKVSPVAHLVIDETPIGNYAELEGPPEWIDATIARLGIDPSTCLTDSYGRLFLAWKERTGSAAENLTFDEIPASAVLQPALH